MKMRLVFYPNDTSVLAFPLVSYRTQIPSDPNDHDASLTCSVDQVRRERTGSVDLSDSFKLRNEHCH